MKIKKAAKAGLVLIYGIVIMGVLSLVHTWHYVDLRAPASMTEELALLENRGGDKYQILHVLGEGCGCSEFTADYLFERGARPGLKEVVYFLGPKETLKQDLVSKGFEVHFKTLEELEKKNKEINGVPLFQVYGKDKSLLHSGGYSNKMITRGTKYLDIPTFKEILADGFAKSNPVFGCAIGQKFINIIDPLGLKY